MKDEDFLEYNEYLRIKAKTDPNFAIQSCFSISDESIEECKNIIQRINDVNDKITIEKKSAQRNELNRRKGKLLEKLAKVLLGSADIFNIKTNIRDHTNEIDLLLTPSDYNRIHKIVLPDYLQNDILIECKNYKDTIKVDWIGKFSSLLNTHRVDLGIIFSYKSFAGKNEWQSSKGLSKKIFLAENKVIININFKDIELILSKNKNIVELIKDKYETLKHQVDYSEYILPHPAEIQKQ
ncbi:restriction endonuclease [Clostridium neonatale]|uniref:restriction endonuclease n=1 Tax=Clostridium neonatale TaxID=137838 RepID=UPI00291BC291|nr:restriction endonuclease [Clostridium neonatale]CAI3660776.1 conserved hypothetical protein [Clostridium neonatale]CAI3693302.1 conserved hypothetical protein [Clostridium neonatale]